MIMPRVARIKNEIGIYHIMVRSISDVSLFRDNLDKDKYLQLIRKYQQIFYFKIYAYCLMSTHAHIAIDCCGADISKIMKAINQCYSAYFNKKYDRHGHVFQDRFKSKLVENDKYLITLSAYIHNNPNDIDAYKDNIGKYKYSSLGVYLGIKSDLFSILDTHYILGHFGTKLVKARINYQDFINNLSDTVKKIDIEFKNDGSECRNERTLLIRDFKVDDIINFLTKYTETSFNIHIKFMHKNSELKSLCVLLLRSLCNLNFREICNIFGNITSSGIHRLCEKGYFLLTTNIKYKMLVSDLIAEYSAA